MDHGRLLLGRTHRDRRRGDGRRLLPLRRVLPGHSAADRTGLAAAAIFILLLAWNEFLFALVLAGGGRAKTLSVAVAQLIGQREIQWNELCAVSTGTIVPLLVFFAWSTSIS